MTYPQYPASLNGRVDQYRLATTGLEHQSQTKANYQTAVNTNMKLSIEILPTQGEKSTDRLPGTISGLSQ